MRTLSLIGLLYSPKLKTISRDAYPNIVVYLSNYMMQPLFQVVTPSISPAPPSSTTMHHPAEASFSSTCHVPA